MSRIGLCSAAFTGLTLLARLAPASTTLAGGSLEGQQTWTLAGSPYIVSGDLSVASGASLTIQPGVDVQFASGDTQAAGNDAARVELTIQGSLQAQGSAAAPITLHAQAGPGANAWYGVVIGAAATAARFDYVDIEDANDAVTNSAPGAVLELTRSTLSHNVAGVWLNAGEPAFSDLVLSNNTAYGVFALANAANIGFTLSNSVARSNGSYGVYLTAALGHSITGAIVNSTIHGNISAGVTGRASGQGSQTTLAITNTIVSSNGILGIDSDATDDGVISFTTSYSDVWSNGLDYSGAVAGVGCISADPDYVAAPADLRLQKASACIDSGSATDAPVLDLLGRARPQGAAVDIGAYEYQAGDDTSTGAAGSSAGSGGDGDLVSELSPAGSAGESGASTGSTNAAGKPGVSGGATSTNAGSGGTPNEHVPVHEGDRDSGCGCQLVGAPTPYALPWLAVALLAARRRRRGARATG